MNLFTFIQKKIKRLNVTTFSLVMVNSRIDHYDIFYSLADTHQKYITNTNTTITYTPVT